MDDCGCGCGCGCNGTLVRGTRFLTSTGGKLDGATRFLVTGGGGAIGMVGCGVVVAASYVGITSFTSCSFLMGFKGTLVNTARFLGAEAVVVVGFTVVGVVTCVGTVVIVGAVTVLTGGGGSGIGVLITVTGGGVLLIIVVEGWTVAAVVVGTAVVVGGGGNGITGYCCWVDGMVSVFITVVDVTGAGCGETMTGDVVTGAVGNGVMVTVSRGSIAKGDGGRKL